MKQSICLGLIFGALVSAQDQSQDGGSSNDRWNWAKTVKFAAKSVEKPKNVQQLVSIVKEAPGNVKVVGTAHSWSDIADTDGTHISMENFKQIEVDTRSMTVTFGAGVTYAELIHELVNQSVALDNLPSLPHINVVGSIMTGTHGSGVHNQAMANYVTELSYVDPNGKKRTLSKALEHDTFLRFLHSFGALGAVYEMTMKIRDEFAVKKCIYKDVDWDIILRNEHVFDTLNYDHDYVTFFTDWKFEQMTSLWITDRVPTDGRNFEKRMGKTFRQVCDDGPFGGQLVEYQHPAPHIKDIPTTGSGMGWWSNKIYYFPPDSPPSMGGMEIASEFYVPYHHLRAAIEDLYAVKDKFAHLVEFSEFRPLEQDLIPLSPGKGQQNYSIHFTWKHDFDQVQEAVREVQNVLKKYEYRVQWGTFWHVEPDYGLFDTFEDDLRLLKNQIDFYPDNKFKNCWIERLLYDNQDCQLDSNYVRDVIQRQPTQTESQESEVAHQDEL